MSSIELIVPSTNADFLAIGHIKAAVFSDKSALCCGTHPQEGARAYRVMSRRHPEKLQHGRAARLSRGDGSASEGEIVGFVQLQLPNDVGDSEIPRWFRHQCETDDEAYIEQIGTSPGHQGKGVGSVLLKWATEFAIENGCRRLTLDVMSENTAAIRLYERKGFVIQNENEDDGSYYCTGILCCLMSCGKYSGVKHMVKLLPEASDGELEKDTATATATSSANVSKTGE